MALDLLAQAFLDQRAAAGARPVQELSVEDARRQSIRLSALSGPGEPVETVEDRTIRQGSVLLPIRVYTRRSGLPLPIVVYFHGGGWVVGNLDSDDARCRWLSNVANAAVVSVNYRHAPEFKFPAAAEDAYAATLWVSANAEQINGDAARLAVAGASAGGNLAAVVALMSRDRGGPAIVYQLLLVPITDYNLDSISYREHGDGFGLTRESMRYYWNHYLPSETDAENPYASPLRAADLGGLPPAHVLVAEFDPLREDGRAYATRLARAGVPTLLTTCAGMVHGFWGDAAMQVVGQALKDALWGAPSAP